MVRRDEGAMESFVLAAILGITALTMLISSVILLTARREQARAAADLAALSALQSPSGCVAAYEAVRRNGARLDHCDLTEDDARVIASVPTGVSRSLLDAGFPARFTATAHAVR